MRCQRFFADRISHVQQTMDAAHAVNKRLLGNLSLRPSSCNGLSPCLANLLRREHMLAYVLPETITDVARLNHVDTISGVHDVVTRPYFSRRIGCLWGPAPDFLEP